MSLSCPFLMVAEPARPGCSPSKIRTGADDIDPSSSTLRLGPTLTSLRITSAQHSAQLFEHHCHEIPRSRRPSPTISPSSSSGGHPPELTDEQLDNIYSGTASTSTTATSPSTTAVPSTSLTTSRNFLHHTQLLTP